MCFLWFSVICITVCCYVVARQRSASQELSALLKEKEEQIAGLMEEGEKFFSGCSSCMHACTQASSSSSWILFS